LTAQFALLEVDGAIIAFHSRLLLLYDTTLSTVLSFV